MRQAGHATGQGDFQHLLSNARRLAGDASRTYARLLNAATESQALAVRAVVPLSATVERRSNDLESCGRGHRRAC